MCWRNYLECGRWCEGGNGVSVKLGDFSSGEVKFILNYYPSYPEFLLNRPGGRDTQTKPKFNYVKMQLILSIAR